MQSSIVFPLQAEGKGHKEVTTLEQSPALSHHSSTCSETLVMGAAGEAEGNRIILLVGTL